MAPTKPIKRDTSSARATSAKGSYAGQTDLNGKPSSAGGVGLSSGTSTNLLSSSKFSLLDILEEQLTKKEPGDAQWALAPRESELIMRALKTNDVDSASLMIRKIFNLRTLAGPYDFLNSKPQVKPRDSTYDPAAEDAHFRDAILNQLILDAVCFTFNTGFTPLQCSVWVTVFISSHNEFVQKYKSRWNIHDALLPADTFLAIFKKTLIKNVNSKSHRLFTFNEIKWMIDFIVEGYAQHASLIINVFTEPQQVAMGHANLQVQIPHSCLSPPQPLAIAIAEEKWEEYCKSEEDAIKAKKQAELDAIENARLKAVADEAARLVQEHQAFLLKQLEDAEKGMVAPFEELPPIAIEKPKTKDIFKKIDPNLIKPIVTESTLADSPRASTNVLGAGKPTGKGGDGDAAAHPGAAGSQHRKSVSSLPLKAAPKNASEAVSKVSYNDGAKGAAKESVQQASQQQVLPQFHISPVPATVLSSEILLDTTPGAPPAEEQSIPMETHLTRSDLMTVIASNIGNAISELDQSLNSRLNQHYDELQARIDRLQSAIRARDEEKNAMEEQQRNEAAQKEAPSTKDAKGKKKK